MKIAIVGYGKMGKEIERIALSRGHETVTIDPSDPAAQFKSISSQSLQGVSCAIEFTHPSQVFSNVTALSQAKINTVIGTTGWYEQMGEMESIIANNDVGAIWSGNFSLGVTIFQRIVEAAASLIDGLPDYDISLHEYHHKGKADSPSGTAQMLAKRIMKNMTRKDTVVTEKLDRAINANELHVSSTRVGAIPGVHSVTIDSSADTIELTHTARTREGFALGAVMAAEFVADKKGFYGIDDLMNAIVGF